MLIIRCSEKVGKEQYEEIALAAFGPRAMLITAYIVITCLLGFVIAYIVLVC
jgi:hypothetical protein